MKDLSKIYSKFKQYFDVENIFMDKILTSLKDEYVFDIVGFDKYLLNKHNYDENKYSMYKFIENEYGKEAADYIGGLL